MVMLTQQTISLRLLIIHGGRSNPSFFDCGDPGTVNANNALMAAGVATVYAAGNDGPGAQTVGVSSYE
jgi:hypothetical protein